VFFSSSKIGFVGFLTLSKRPSPPCVFPFIRAVTHRLRPTSPLIRFLRATTAQRPPSDVPGTIQGCLPDFPSACVFFLYFPSCWLDQSHPSCKCLFLPVPPRSATTNHPPLRRFKIPPPMHYHRLPVPTDVAPPLLRNLSLFILRFLRTCSSQRTGLLFSFNFVSFLFVVVRIVLQDFSLFQMSHAFFP